MKFSPLAAPEVDDNFRCSQLCNFGQSDIRDSVYGNNERKRG